MLSACHVSKARTENQLPKLGGPLRRVHMTLLLDNCLDRQLNSTCHSNSYSNSHCQCSGWLLVTGAAKYISTSCVMLTTRTRVQRHHYLSRLGFAVLHIAHDTAHHVAQRADVPASPRQHSLACVILHTGRLPHHQQASQECCRRSSLSTPHFDQHRRVVCQDHCRYSEW